jgi:hypothetical protein
MGASVEAVAVVGLVPLSEETDVRKRGSSSLASLMVMAKFSAGERVRVGVPCLGVGGWDSAGKKDDSDEEGEMGRPFWRGNSRF